MKKHKWNSSMCNPRIMLLRTIAILALMFSILQFSSCAVKRAVVREENVKVSKLAVEKQKAKQAIVEKYEYTMDELFKSRGYDPNNLSYGEGRPPLLFTNSKIISTIWCFPKFDYTRKRNTQTDLTWPFSIELRQIFSNCVVSVEIIKTQTRDKEKIFPAQMMINTSWTDYSQNIIPLFQWNIADDNSVDVTIFGNRFDSMYFKNRKDIFGTYNLKFTVSIKSHSKNNVNKKYSGQEMDFEIFLNDFDVIEK